MPTPGASQNDPNIVVIGGGTGSFVVLSALKAHTRNITAIVNMSDNGGSTGILRDELGALPPGDVRQCLVALSKADKTMRDLFSYRFEDGALVGHSFGNLFLTALEKTTGSFAQAVDTASRVLNITGQVIPITLTDNQLVLTEPNGAVIQGQHEIESYHFGVDPPKFSLEPAAKLNPKARLALAQAELIVIAPSNLYTSLAPMLMVSGLAEALHQSPAKLVYITNLVTKPGQTDGFKVHDFVRELERFIAPNTIDYVIFNQHKPSPALLKKYAYAGEFAVGYNKTAFEQAHYQAIGADLVSEVIPKLGMADQLIPRTLIRHDSAKLAQLIMRAYTGAIKPSIIRKGAT